MRKRNKLSAAQLFTFTYTVHMSFLILFTYVKPAKFKSVCYLRDRGNNLGGFSMLRKFYVRTDVYLAGSTYLNE